MFVTVLLIIALVALTFAQDCGIYGSHCGDCTSEPGCVYCRSANDLGICLESGSLNAQLCTAVGGQIYNGTHINSKVGVNIVSTPGVCNAAEDAECPQYTRNGTSDCTGCLAHSTSKPCGFCMVGGVTGACVNVKVGDGAPAGATCQLSVEGTFIYPTAAAPYNNASACPWQGVKEVSSCAVNHANSCSTCQDAEGCTWCRSFESVGLLLTGYCTDTAQASLDLCPTQGGSFDLAASSTDFCIDRSIVGQVDSTDSQATQASGATQGGGGSSQAPGTGPNDDLPSASSTEGQGQGGEDEDGGPDGQMGTKKNAASSVTLGAAAGLLPALLLLNM